MTGLILRLLPPGSFLWLVLHELRLGLSARRGKRRLSLSGVFGWLVFAVWLGIGVLIGFALQDVHITPNKLVLVGTLAGAIVLFTLMTTQALMASQRTLYESGDLDLLFSAPIRPSVVTSAKLVGIVATIAVTYATLLLPIVLPVAIIGHPQLLGLPVLLLALALLAACVGLVLTLVIAKIAGPRAARTIGQIVAGLMGGAFFLASQLSRGDSPRSDSAVTRMFHWFDAHGYGSRGWTGIPGRAAFGAPGAVAIVLAVGLAAFLLTAWGMNRLFLASYRAGGMRLSRTTRVRGGVAKQFREGLFATVFAKEWKLLARDPALAFQVVLRLVYLVPLFLVGMRNPSFFAPTMAFMSVVIAGQMVGSLAWLTVSAEDTPDLIRVAPVDKDRVDRAKMSAALAMALPFTLILPAAIATRTIPGALVTFLVTLLGGWLTALLEVKFGKPAQRSSFRRRGASGGLVRVLLQFAITIALGGIAAGTVFTLTSDMSQLRLPSEWRVQRSAPGADEDRLAPK